MEKGSHFLNGNSDARHRELQVESENTHKKLKDKGLTDRETEILAYLAQGKTNSEIGISLHITTRTVSTHLEHIYSKLCVRSRTGAVAVLLKILQETPAPQKDTKNIMKVDTRMKRVLLVDDDVNIRKVLRALLEYKGYLCEEAENGLSALEWLNRQHADLMITDSHMPGLGGLAFLERLSAAFIKTQTPFLPVIVLSGNLNDDLRERLSQLGVYTSFSKPPKFDVLLSTVAQAVGNAPPNKL